MNNYTEQQGERFNQANRLINQYYLFMHAADMILREALKLVEKEGAMLKGPFKQRHSQMMQSAKVMKAHHSRFEFDYRNAFPDYRVWDDMRKDSNPIARLGLLISDRCYNDEQTEVRIESLIKNIKSKDVINPQIIEEFRLR